MEKCGKICLLVLLFCGSFCVAPSMATAGQDSSEKRVAVVNEAIISQTDFNWEIDRAKKVYGRGMPLDGNRLEEIKKRALENLIDRELLYQESVKKGVKVDPATVEAQYSAMKSRFPSEEMFNKEIEKANFTEAALRKQLERAIATQQFIEKEIVEGINISDKEISDYYTKNKARMKQPEQVRASHILIKVDPKATSEEKQKARKQMAMVVEKIKKGEDFATLAKEQSQCPSAARGGDLGFFRRGQMVPPFEKAAFALKPGEVSDIVETNFGYHVIKLVDKRPEAIMPLKDVKEQLERHLREQAINDAIGKYLGELKKEAKIEKFFPGQP